MRFSIVTISYNQAEFIERTILSVLNQNYRDLQYIVVDPGSTDGSREIISKYTKNINNIVFEEDSGPSNGLNKGFDLANGKIYGFLNSDDVLYPGALSEVAYYFENNPAIDIVSGHSFIIDEHDNIIRKSYSQKMNLSNYAYGACILNQPSTFFKKEIFLKVNGFNEGNKSNWDGELFVDMALNSASFGVVNKFWSGYRLHDISITASAKLNSEINDYYKRMYTKIYKKDPKSIDKIKAKIKKTSRLIKNPKFLYERLKNGPIYGRNKKNKKCVI